MSQTAALQGPVSLYTRLASKVLFPAQELLKRHSTVAVRRQLEQTQYWPLPQLRALQLKRLRALLARAYAQSPYYREVMDGIGMDPARDVHALEDLRRLPLLDKPTIRAQSDRIRAADARDLARFNTGGSSGEPLIFYIGKERVSHDVAAKWRATRWWNVDIGDPEIVVWGSPIETGAQDRMRELRDEVFRTELLPAFEMSIAKLDHFVERIRARRPRMLFGYPSALSHIARHARLRGQRMDDLGIRVAFVTSERLYDEQREQIEQVFGCPVANGYGGRDAGFIAHQCPSGGMHITAEDIIVEILDGEGQPVPDGEAGEIVVTHLATGDYPFIRYRTGDVGVLDTKPCSCGRGLPLLKEIQGRATDFVVAQDGTVLHGLSLIYVLRDLPGVQAFKIVQESLDLTRVQVVLAVPLDHALRERIVAGFRARLGAQVNVEVEQVSEIGAEKSGKYRYVISKVARP
jgi:phenylacetate-CoA ligase